MHMRNAALLTCPLTVLAYMVLKPVGQEAQSHKPTNRIRKLKPLYEVQYPHAQPEQMHVCYLFNVSGMSTIITKLISISGIAHPHVLSPV